VRSFGVRPALLCVLVAGTLGAAHPSLDGFLARMRAASGPVWDAHIVSVTRERYEGTMTVVATESEGLRFLLRRCVGELCDGRYFDGTRLFAVDINGTSLPRTDAAEPYLRALRLAASLEFLRPGFAAGGRRVDDGGMVARSGKHYRSMFVIDPAALPLQVFVDPTTALVRYVRVIGSRDLLEYRDYRRSQDLTLPYEVLDNGSVIERYDDRTPVASAFTPPRGLIPEFHGPPQPIATDPAYQTPIVPCRIAEVAVRCLLDSGNSGLSMSSELASRLGAPVIGSYDVRGLGGYTTQVVRAGPLTFGNLTYPPANYVVLRDLRRYGYDAVLGADVFASTTIDLDVAQHTVTFGAPPLRGSVALPLRFDSFVPVATVRLGDLPVQLAVDTGDESSINLAYGFYAQHPELFSVTRRRAVAGIGGTSIEMIGRIEHVTIANFQMDSQPIGATQTLSGTASGHLGAAFWAQFAVQFDYAAGELRLVPAATGISARAKREPR
jgi:hypothetical protein